MKHRVTVIPQGTSFEMDENHSLLENLKSQGFFIKSSCGGHATCSDCVVKVITGETNVLPPEFAEIKLLGNVFHITGERLSCQAKVCGDVTIDISAHKEGLVQEGLQSKSKKVKTMIRTRKSQEAKEQAEMEKSPQEEIPPKQGGFSKPKYAFAPKKKYQKKY